jgi:translocation and assembly module TamB
VRRLVTTITAAVVVLLLLLVAVTALVTTETGLQLAWPRLAALAGPALSVESVSGRLAGPLRLQGVRYQTDSDTLAADEVLLDWDPLALPGGTLQVRKLAGRGVHYRHTGEAPAGRGTPVVLPEHIRLPLAIALQDLLLEDASVAFGSDAQPFRVEVLRLALQADGSRLSVERLELVSPDMQLQGGVTLDATGVYPVQGGISVSAALPDYAPIVADLGIDGSLRQLELSLEVQPPYAASAGLQLGNLFDVVQISGSLQLQATELAAINATWPALRLDAAVLANGTSERLLLEANASSEGEPAVALQARLAGILQPDALVLESLLLTANEGRTQVHASGRLGLDAAQPAVALQADWRQLAWPPEGPAAVNSAQGKLVLRGSFDAWAVDADALLDVPDITTGRMQVAGRGDRQGFDIDSLTVKALEGRLAGSGRLDWTNDFNAALVLDGEGLNPAGLHPDWPGQLDLQLQLGLLVQEAGWQVSFDAATASGTLRDLPLRFSGRGSYRPGRVVVRDARLASGPSRLAFDGELGERLAIDWQLDSPDLATLLPSASGSLAGSGSLLGKPSEAHLVTTLTGSGLRYRGDRIDALSLDASLDMSGRSESHLDLRHGNGSVSGVVINSLHLQGRGQPQAHRLELAVDAAPGNLALQVEGNWQAPDWLYRMSGATLTLAGDASPWRLAGAVDGRIGPTRATLPEACWQNADAVTCLHGARDSDGTQAGFRLENLPLAHLLRLLETDVGVTGTLSGAGELQQRTGQPLQAQASLRSTAGHLQAAEHDATRELLVFGAGSAELQVDRKGARLEARLPVEGGGLTLQAALDNAGEAWTERGLSGNARLLLPDIAFAGRLHPEVSRLGGRLDGDVRLSGSLGAPGLLGRLVVTDGEAVLATPGLTLTDIGIDIRGQQSGDLLVSARARSGEGLLSLDGQASLTATVPTARLKLSGENVLVVNTPEAEILASPDLELALAGTRIDLSGKIRVPRARIEPRKLPESAVTVSGDQVIVTGSEPAESRKAYQFYSRVRFVLGDDVRFDGLGLKGKLTGNLLTISEPERPASATGELAIRDGSYRAYGQNLEIRTGRLLFAGGPVSAPGLDVEAVRRPAADVLVGVRVRGSLHEPRFTVFSEPGMSQSRQLSWLVLGRDLESNASDEERSAINEAALMLGMSGGETLGKRLGEKVGVDEVSIASEPGATTTQAALLVGKYLTPELFVSYGIGLFEPVSTLRLRYTLTSRWKLIGEASAERSSADIFYVIERGE